MPRRIAPVALFLVAWAVLAGCSAPAPTGGSSGSLAPGGSLPAEAPPSAGAISPSVSALPVPTPTGPALTTAMAKASHFLLFVGGSLSDQAVTRIEGRDAD